MSGWGALAWRSAATPNGRRASGVAQTLFRSKSAALQMGNIHNWLICGLGINGPRSADRRGCGLRPFLRPSIEANECDCGVRYGKDADHKFGGPRYLALWIACCDRVHAKRRHVCATRDRGKPGPAIFMIYCIMECQAICPMTKSK